jgi:predicted 3-demethylubiquinone-9 3-methyltransferase (glyoxalase superfamily)
MFAGEASSALDMYSSIFRSFRVDRIEHFSPGEQGVEGWVKYAEASLEGHALIVIDSPVKHDFAFTPAMSLFLDCESQAELDTAFEKLSADGQIFMPLNNYGFSTRFGWCADRFGVSWQLNLP